MTFFILTVKNYCVIIFKILGDFMKNNSKAQIMMIISMVIFGTIGIFIRNIPLSSGEISL